MKKFHQSGLCLFVMALTILCHSASNLPAATPPPPQPPSAGSKVGGFFKGLFYGRSSSGRYMGETPNTRSNAPGYSLDRPPQENAASSASAPVERIEPVPLPPQESDRQPKEEVAKNTASETRLPATKPAPRKTEPPPVTMKPAADEALPSEAPKAPATVETKPVAPKGEPGVATNTPAPEPGKPAAEPKVNPPAPAASTGGLPVGSRTDKPGRVKSPYPPYNELDVSGLQSGSLAMDPTTQKVFRLP